MTFANTLLAVSLLALSAQAQAASCTYELFLGGSARETFKASVPGKATGAACAKARMACNEFREENGIEIFTCNSQGGAPFEERVKALCYVWNPGAYDLAKCKSAGSADAVAQVVQSAFDVYTASLCADSRLGDAACVSVCEEGRFAGNGEMGNHCR